MPCIRGIEVILVTYPAKQIIKEYPHPDGTSLRLVNKQEAATTFAGSLSSAGPSSASAAPAVPTRKADPKSSVYIATQPGSQFIIGYEAKTIPENCKYLLLKAYINGRHQVTCGRDLEESTRGVICRTLWSPSEPLEPYAGIEGRQFMFLHEDGPKSAAEDGGVIEVRIHRASARSLRSPALQEFRRARQYGIATPSTGLIDNPEDVEYYMYHLIDSKEIPYVRFFFHYRSMESLVELNLVPQESLQQSLPELPPLPPIPDDAATRSAMRRRRRDLQRSSRERTRQTSNQTGQELSSQTAQHLSSQTAQESFRQLAHQWSRQTDLQSSVQSSHQSFSEAAQKPLPETPQRPLREIFQESQQLPREITPQPFREITYGSDRENAPQYLAETTQQSTETDSHSDADNDRTPTRSTYLWFDGASEDDRPTRRSSNHTGGRNQSRSSSRHAQSSGASRQENAPLLSQSRSSSRHAQGSQSRRAENAPLLDQGGRSNNPSTGGYGIVPGSSAGDSTARARTHSQSPAPSLSSSLKRSIDDSDFDEDVEIMETKVVRYSKVLQKPTLLDLGPSRNSASSDLSRSNTTAGRSAHHGPQPATASTADCSSRQSFQPTSSWTTGSSARHSQQPATTSTADRSGRHSYQPGTGSIVQRDFAYDRPQSFMSPPHPAVRVPRSGTMSPRDEPSPFGPPPPPSHAGNSMAYVGPRRTDRPPSTANPPHPAVRPLSPLNEPRSPRDEPAPLPYRRISSIHRWSPTPGHTRRESYSSSYNRRSDSTTRPLLGGWGRDSEDSSSRQSSIYPLPPAGRVRSEEMVRGVINYTDRRPGPPPVANTITAAGSSSSRGPTSTTTQSQGQGSSQSQYQLPYSSQGAGGGITSDWSALRDLGNRQISGQTFIENRQRRDAQSAQQPSQAQRQPSVRPPSGTAAAPTLFPPRGSSIRSAWTGQWDGATN